MKSAVTMPPGSRNSRKADPPSSSLADGKKRDENSGNLNRPNSPSNGKKERHVSTEEKKDHSPSPSERKSRSRSRSHSHDSESENPRRRGVKRARSSSKSPQRSSAFTFDANLMQNLIDRSVSSALMPLQQQLKKLSNPVNDVSQLQLLRQQQKQLEIETKSASLTSPGAQSQFRCLANIQLSLNNAIEGLDDVLPKFEDGAAELFSDIRNQISSAAEQATDRIEMIFRADSDPKIGWKALSIYDEKRKASTDDPEKLKMWTSCLKAASDAQKKSTSKNDRQPFRSQPGWQSGRNAFQGQNASLIKF